MPAMSALARKSTPLYFEETPLTLGALGPYRVEDYLALPDEPRCELIHGNFYVTASPAIRHQFLVIKLGKLLDTIAEASGGFAFVAPLDVELAAHSVVQPDVIYVTPERRAILKDFQGRLFGAPDLLVEILSPGSLRRDRFHKLDLYLRSGVREYWIVDPAERQIEFLVEDQGRYGVALPEGNVYRSTALSEISLDLEAFWGDMARRLG